jgi:hypothetical protein
MPGPENAARQKRRFSGSSATAITPILQSAEKWVNTGVTKLVYIGGYGHSGSTLLEYLLTASPDVIACGEVASVVREGLKKKKCTCGRPAKECPVWGAHLTSGKLAASSHADLDASLLAQEGAPYAALVDSSKTAGAYALAPFRLRRKAGSDFLLVHLVRDPRAVCWSAIKKTERRR